MEEREKPGIGRLVASAAIPIIVLGAMIAFLLWPGNSVLNVGVALPDVTIERVEFGDKLITAHIRNTGAQSVDIAQADVNDRIIPAAIEPSKTIPRLAEAQVIIPFTWIKGQPYVIGVTTSDGARFSTSIHAAALTPKLSAGQASFLALIGTYVGVIPVLIGLLWLPFLKRLSSAKYAFFLSLTAGLLLFLGIDALVEANEIAAQKMAGALGGQMLIATVTVVSFVALLYASDKLVGRKGARTAGAFAVALMIAVGIGLHNLGEGLAIGGSMVAGEVALSTFLIVGFAIHNMTEGLAIVAPVARERVNILRLAVLGLVAGAPAIAGTWIGGFVSSPIASVAFLSVGAGAVFQVVYVIFKFAGRDKFPSGPTVAGLAAGMLLMYLTSLLV